MRARRHRGFLSALILSICGVLLTGPAFAKATRRFFQPTDSQLEEPGTAQLDLQLDYVRGHDGYRIAVPDFELDVGLCSTVELDVDGAFVLEDTAGESRSLNHVNPDNTWVAGKFLITDDIAVPWCDGLDVAAQLGPKLPTASDTHGVGAEGLALANLKCGPTQITFNAGALGDPPVEGSGRPIGFEGGADISYDLVEKTLKLQGTIGAVHFFSADPDQLTVMAGVAWNLEPWLEVSAMGLVGGLAGGDRYGIVLGFTPTFCLWN